MYKMSQDERERYLYLREEMAYSDEISRMKTAREEGLEEGRKEGRKEGKQLFLQCIRLKKQGFSKEKIAELAIIAYLFYKHHSRFSHVRKRHFLFSSHYFFVFQNVLLYLYHKKTTLEGSMQYQAT